VLIVEVASLFVAEDFVGLRNGFELFVGFFALLVGDLVGVGGEWLTGAKGRVIYFMVCFLDLSLGRRALDVQDLYAC
jgi:hypothetical protein